MNAGEAIFAFNAILLMLVVILAVLEVTLVSNAAILLAFEVILEVLDEIIVGNVLIVEELIPPTVFTVGKSAVPPRSFVNFILPFKLEVASGVAVAAIPEATPEFSAD